MPTYLFHCEACDADLEVWQSIHSDAIPDHDCGNALQKVIVSPALHGIGTHGSKTLRVDAKEKQWSSDMDAYKRLRRDGLQPRQIDGCHEIEASAQSVFEIQSGIKGLPEHRVTETFDMIRDAGGM